MTKLFSCVGLVALSVGSVALAVERVESSASAQASALVFMENDGECVATGCRRTIGSTSVPGGANTCLDSVQLHADPNEGQDGSCFCDGTTCLSDLGAECTSKTTFTVNVTPAPGSTWTYCSGQSWVRNGNELTISLESEPLDCSKGIGSQEEASSDLFIMCGSSDCESATVQTSAHFVQVRVFCWSCKSQLLGC